MKLNFVLNNFGNNQITNSILEAVNQLLVNETGKCSPCIFTSVQHSSILKPVVPIFNVVDLYAQPGVGIATDILSALYVLDAMSLDTRIIYLSHYEGSLTNSNTFLHIKSVLENMDLIICRSEEQKKHVEEFFRVRVAGVMQDIDLEQTYTIVEDHRNKNNISGVQLTERLKPCLSK